MKIINSTSYKKISVICNEKEYFPGKDKAFIIDDKSEEVSITVRIYDNHRVIFNFLYFLFDGFVDSENFVFDLYSDAKFDLRIKQENSDVYLKDLIARDADNNIIYNSTYLYSNDIIIKNINFDLNNTDNVRCKYWFIFFVLWLPAVIFSLLCLFVDGTVPVFLGLVVLLLFVLFAFRKFRRYKAVFNNDRASAFLYAKDEEFRQNNNEEAPYEPRGIIEKGVFKTLDILFKNKNK